MRKDAIQLEEARLSGGGEIELPVLHERHRVFPAVFENRKHHRVMDLAAGVGYVIRRIRDHYPSSVFANDISPSCLNALRQLEVPVLSYTLDHDTACFPFEAGSFDAVVALATIEHIIHVDRFVQEVYRILNDTGYFYVSAPNYASAPYLYGIISTGRTFHNPLEVEDRYEFYAHVRYFTYRTLLEYISTFGFVAEAVYLPLPHSSTRYQTLQAASKWKAMTFRQVMGLLYRLSPRWASEPILCFRKASSPTNIGFRKVIL